MSTRDDVKQIADNNNKLELELRAKTDSVLSTIYKSIYQTASRGEYKICLSIHKKDWQVYRKAFDVLESEKFKIIPIEGFTNKNKIALVTISWED